MGDVAFLLAVSCSVVAGVVLLWSVADVLLGSRANPLMLAIKTSFLVVAALLLAAALIVEAA